ncbi:unnamed protein product [Acanthosepion pharaonis]|uniref:Uncharacterized protein n=1 Tax=Acanthosepion pharaonis TaxID=158019 RepID=A0A812C2L1_ACAPH|nr:unnamed protein product [Sepia pharaonis]
MTLFSSVFLFVRHSFSFTSISLSLSLSIPLSLSLSIPLSLSVPLSPDFHTFICLPFYVLQTVSLACFFLSFSLSLPHSLSLCLSSPVFFPHICLSYWFLSSSVRFSVFPSLTFPIFLLHTLSFIPVSFFLSLSLSLSLSNAPPISFSFHVYLSTPICLSLFPCFFLPLSLSLSPPPPSSLLMALAFFLSISSSYLSSFFRLLDVSFNELDNPNPTIHQPSVTSVSPHSRYFSRHAFPSIAMNFFSKMAIALKVHLRPTFTIMTLNNAFNQIYSVSTTSAGAAAATHLAVTSLLVGEAPSTLAVSIVIMVLTTGSTSINRTEALIFVSTEDGRN